MSIFGKIGHAIREAAKAVGETAVAVIETDEREHEELREEEILREVSLDNSIEVFPPRPPVVVDGLVLVEGRDKPHGSYPKVCFKCSRNHIGSIDEEMVTEDGTRVFHKECVKENK